MEKKRKEGSREERAVILKPGTVTCIFISPSIHWRLTHFLTHFTLLSLSLWGFSFSLSLWSFSPVFAPLYLLTPYWTSFPYTEGEGERVEEFQREREREREESRDKGKVKGLHIHPSETGWGKRIRILTGDDTRILSELKNREGKEKLGESFSAWEERERYETGGESRMDDVSSRWDGRLSSGSRNIISSQAAATFITFGKIFHPSTFSALYQRGKVRDILNHSRKE